MKTFEIGYEKTTMLAQSGEHDNVDREKRMDRLRGKRPLV